jgi:putative addiction module component (TIGR02574 family)
MISLPLKEMSRAEKIMALEALWEDLSRDEAEFESPGWHQDELKATADRVQAGKEQPVDWEHAKKRLRNR